MRERFVVTLEIVVSLCQSEMQMLLTLFGKCFDRRRESFHRDKMHVVVGLEFFCIDQIDECADEIRLKGQGDVEFGQRLVELAEFLERIAEIVVRIGEIALEYDGLPVALDRTFCLRRLKKG